jgi:hypothetical protein
MVERHRCPGKRDRLARDCCDAPRCHNLNFVPGGSVLHRQSRRTQVTASHRSCRIFAGGISLRSDALSIYSQASVVLPDHLHSIWWLPYSDADYAARWRLIKAAFSRALPAGRADFTEPLAQGRARHLATPLLGAHTARMSATGRLMSITSTSIRAKHGWVTRCGTGRIRLFTAWSDSGLPKRLGRRPCE